MRNTINLLIICFLAFTATQCSDSNAASSSANNGGLTISGTIAGVNSIQVFFDRIGLTPASSSLVQARTDASPSGAFEITLEEKPKAGIYRLRFGLQKINLILDGTESNIVVGGELGSIKNFTYTIEGSQGSADYKDMMAKLVTRTANVKDVTTYVQNTSNSLAGSLVAIQAFGTNKQYVEIMNQSKNRLAEQFPGSSYINEFGTFISSLEKITNTGRGFVMVEEGKRQAAPDISLPNPDGKEYSLSDLKGKVVLVDFWASWCRPCRVENPHVVEAYKKFKDQGFTVFSVSLDGIDSRTAKRFNGDADRLADAMKQQKKRWVDAIKKDGLVWDTHVSDLKKWECAPAKSYGVSSIPRTFMIDREGNIAAMNLRGSQVEEVLQQLL